MKKSISDRIRIFIMEILRRLVRILYVIPIRQNRILFTSYIGKEYSCNPKYLSEYLQNRYPGEYEIIWAFKDVSKFADVKGIKKIPYKSLVWLLYVITAKVIVVNNGAVWVPRRSGQMIIDTWHGGGCYKRVDADAIDASELTSYRTKISGQEVSLYLSSSKYFSENVVRKSFMFSGEILPSGMPRNDILFEHGDIRPREALRQEIAKKYLFDPQDYIVLFAPTWRKGSPRVEQLDTIELRKVLKKKFGQEAAILGRGHHRENKILEKDVIDVTTYPDMQELLLAADMLITDYSSSIWDFSFTGKPCFLFTPDLDSYSVDPGFDCDIYTWGFPVCRSNDELLSAIESFDVDGHKMRMEKHHADLNSYENGHACEVVCEHIRMFCGGS